MALLESITTLKLGTKMPDIALNDPEGNAFTTATLTGEKGLLIAFTCNHCPYALAVWPRLIAVANYAETLGINSVAINPNINPDYPDDSPEKMVEKIEEWGVPFPYLVDETQSTAQAYQAQCTPDIYLLDATQTLVYHGRIDDNWQQPDQVQKEDLKIAITALANGQPIDANPLPCLGCSIKWL